MANDLLDSTGARIMWARKRRDWTQKTLGLRVGVRSVYISQIESGSRRASRALIAKIARELGVSIGFLELETDEPTPPKTDAAPEPNYWHAETDELARLADAMPETTRRYLLEHARLVASYVDATRDEVLAENAKRFSDLIISGGIEPAPAPEVRKRGVGRKKATPPKDS